MAWDELSFLFWCDSQSKACRVRKMHQLAIRSRKMKGGLNTSNEHTASYFSRVFRRPSIAWSKAFGAGIPTVISEIAAGAIRAMRGIQAPFNARIGELFSRGSSYNWLLAYFFFNLALTIYNKLVLNGNFPFPYTLTAVHAFCAAIGSWLCLERNVFSMPQLKKSESVQIILFSVLYTINIVTSNVSLYIPYRLALTADTWSLFLSIKSFDPRHLCL